MRAFEVPVSEKQEMVLEAFDNPDITYIGYGGARKGGKSWIGRYGMIDGCLRFPGTYSIILRRTMSEVLSNHEDKIHECLKVNYGLKPERDYTWNNQEAVFTFHKFQRSGIPSRLFLGHLADMKAARRYVGNPYLRVMFDEVTQIPEDLYLFVLGSLANEYYPETVPKVFACTNPGNEYDAWFRNQYVRESTRNPNTLWIQALPQDNPFFMATDKTFISRMRVLYKNQPWRLRQWLEGDWNASPDNFFVLQDGTFCTRQSSGMDDAYWGETVAGVDYGFNYSAFAVVYAHKWRTRMGRDRMHVFSEIVKHNLFADQQARISLAHERDVVQRPIARRWGDPSILTVVARQTATKEAPADKNVQQMWIRNGWIVRESKKAQKAYGLMLLNMLLRDGTLTIDTSCLKLMEEMSDAKYAKDTNGKTLDVTDPKQPDDVTDALRFLVVREYYRKYERKLRTAWDELYENNAKVLYHRNTMV